MVQKLRSALVLEIGETQQCGVDNAIWRQALLPPRPARGVRIPPQSLLLSHHDRDGKIVKIAGVCGPREQAVAEARLAAKLHYHAGQ